jgi:UDP-N-acetylglucosamine--N-acetylmuramyl-(pentapeptide) pyrophosphoryl-undecaprenol N-acetylglucosamine transferase
MFSDEKILIVSGGTFGHIYPALIFQKIYGGTVFLNKNSQKFLNNCEQYQFFDFQKTINPFIILLSMIKFIKTLFFHDVLVVFGGYSSLPVILASIFFPFKKKYFHEQNACLGLVNRLAYYMRFIPLLSFKDTKFISKCNYFKSPILLGYHIEKMKQSAIEKIILVIPGSGGSVFFDEKIAPIIAEFAVKSHYIVYFVSKNQKISELFVGTHYIQPFFFDIDEIFAKADIIIGRAGAGIIAKILLYGKRSIIIPLKDSAHNHQLYNAEASGITYISEDNLSQLGDLLRNNNLSIPKSSKMLLSVLV